MRMGGPPSHYFALGRRRVRSASDESNLWHDFTTQMARSVQESLLQLLPFPLSSDRELNMAWRLLDRQDRVPQSYLDTCE